MQLSRKADYALRAIRFLSRLPRSEVASISRISQSEAIPREFMAKVLKQLTHKGIIVSFQGVKGGYRMARKPKDVTCLQVIEAMNGPIHLNLCTEFDKRSCNCVADCGIHAFWATQESKLKRRLSHNTFGRYVSKGKATEGS